MKYSLGKPKLLIQADDFYDFMSQEASAFFAFINAFTTFLRRLIMLTSLSLIFLVGLVMGAIGIDCTYKRLLTEDKTH